MFEALLNPLGAATLSEAAAHCLPHARELRLGWIDGACWRMRLDQGLGYWRTVSGVRATFSFDAAPERQATFSFDTAPERQASRLENVWKIMQSKSQAWTHGIRLSGIWAKSAPESSSVIPPPF